MQTRRIVAMGGGGFSMEPENLALDRFVVSLARAARPRVCFLPTASGDSDAYTVGFYRAFCELDCRPTDLQLFRRTIDDLRAFVLAQDVIYVGGGNTASHLAVWRAHGLDQILRAAWEEGVVLCGISAGMNCWFEQSVTDSFGSGSLSALHDGVGLLPGSCCPHYDGEDQRRPTYRRLVGAGELMDGWAAEDGAALVFAGEELVEIVASRPAAAAYRVTRTGTGTGVDERRVEARYLQPG